MTKCNDSTQPSLKQEIISKKDAHPITTVLDRLKTVLRRNAPKTTSPARILFSIITLLALLLTITASPALATSLTAGSQDIQPSLPLRAAFVYPWFPEAWTQQGIYPYTNYHPSLGYYDSSSLGVIQNQIAAMQYAHIAAGILSWWGQGSKTDKRVAAILSATAGSTFRWSIYYEPEGQGNPSVSQITSDLTYIKNNYGSNPSYLRIGGRFVVFVYADASDGCSMATRWKQANTIGAYIVLKVFSGYKTCADQPDGWHQYAPAEAADSQGKYSYSISPGFWKVGEPPRLSRDLTRWNTDIRNMIASNAAFQLITTFNEWGEGTAVESANEWASSSGFGAYLDALHNNGNSAASPTATPTSAATSPTPAKAATATSVPASTSTSAVTPTQTINPTATLSGSTVTFVPNADAYVTAAYPTTNYGNNPDLRVDNLPLIHSYIRFDVQGVSSVSNATLKIYANSSSSSGFTVWSVVNNNWTESTITFNNAPALGTSLNSSSPFNSGTWLSINVSSFVKAPGVYTLGLSDLNDTAISLGSRESTHPPQLVINTSASTTGLTSTPTLVATSTKTSVPTLTPTKSATQTTVAAFTPTKTNTPAPTLVATATRTSTSTPGPTTTPGSLTIQHVFEVVMENHSYNEVWNTSSSPYITSLGNTYARATNYFATTHPSLPNYLDLYGGSNYSVSTDCSPSASCSINAVNLGDNMDAKGLTWKSYEEAMPSPCDLTSSGTYAPKHNPMVYFDDIYLNTARCNAHDVPYTNLAADLASASTTPNFSFITPNLCNDMHDCSVSTGDTWLKNNLPAILNSPACTVDKCLLIVTWDEDDGSQNNQVLTIFAGSAAKTGGATSSVHYTHFSLLRTIEYIFGLPAQTGNDAAASPMTDLLR